MSTVEHSVTGGLTLYLDLQVVESECLLLFSAASKLKRHLIPTERLLLYWILDLYKVNISYVMSF